MPNQLPSTGIIGFAIEYDMKRTKQEHTGVLLQYFGQYFAQKSADQRSYHVTYLGTEFISAKIIKISDAGAPAQPNRYEARFLITLLDPTEVEAGELLSFFVKDEESDMSLVDGNWFKDEFGWRRLEENA